MEDQGRKKYLKGRVLWIVIELSVDEARGEVGVQFKLLLITDSRGRYVVKII